MSGSSPGVSSTTTSAPSRASRTAWLRPMPRPAPVMKATLPVRRPATMCSRRPMMVDLGNVSGACRAGQSAHMEFRDVVRKRHMVRDYDPDRPVPPEVRERLLEHAIRAPSAGFSQGWAFLVLESPEERDRFWAATTDAGDAPDPWLIRMRRAPLLIVPLSHKAAYLERYAESDKGWTDRDEARWPVPYWDIDTGMASLLILLT